MLCGTGLSIFIDTDVSWLCLISPRKQSLIFAMQVFTGFRTLERMNAIRILVANEPRSYREVIAGTIQALHPESEVICVEPDQLDGEVIRLSPHLVLCSELTETVETHARCWVTLYPGGDNYAVIGIDRRRIRIENIEFSTLSLVFSLASA